MIRKGFRVMLNVSQCGINNSTAFGAKPKFVGAFSKEAKDALKNIPAIKEFKGDVTFSLRKGLKNSMLSSSGNCKKLQMNATLGNRGKLLETNGPVNIDGNLLTKSFIKSYKDCMSDMLSALTNWKH